ncbi:MAG: VWA domain-containing protein [Colwellia sp.]|nr:VWA domain-containing protein [Colwellia sp.]
MSDTNSNMVKQLSTFFTPDFTLASLINNFHFIRPLWLLAFLGLFLLLFVLKKIRYYQSPWQHFLPPHLAGALLENSASTIKKNATEIASSTQSRYWLKPLIIGSCIIIALAGPAWQKLPQPVYQLERGSVLIMDMSYSMYATDVKPNRLTRARYKATDLLTKINEGDVGLIAYAGDAFIISPLTQDINNIELLLPSLSPDIMPVHGANALAALTLADKTLKNAGHISGDIYWFTDDIENDEMSDIYNWANSNSHKVNILGVGSEVGAPIKLSSGELLKDNRGAIVIPKLPEGRLSAITKRSRGVYHTMTNDDSDIKALTAHLTAALNENLNLDVSKPAQDTEHKQVLQGDQYKEQGPWLLLIILPLVLSYFRRGSSILSLSWLMPLTFILSFVSISPVSYAAQSNTTNENLTSTNTTPAIDKSTHATTATERSGASQFWRDLWQTSDQQGQQHYFKEEYQQAAEQFNNSQWQGSAHYKAGEYQQALDAFKQSDTAQALYNQGNALAQLQQIDEAIDAYKNALAKDPSLTDAQDNLEQLEALKKQQEQSQQSQDGEKNKQDEQSKQDSEQQSEGQSQGEQEDQGDQEQGEQTQQEQQQGEQQQSDETQQQKEAEQQQKDSEKAQEPKEQDEKSRQAEEANDDKKSDEEKMLAEQASDSKAQETQQKHQQLLNKVTDDPYLLLRNKMRLEYQKRRHESAPRGETKKW